MSERLPDEMEEYVQRSSDFFPDEGPGLGAAESLPATRLASSSVTVFHAPSVIEPDIRYANNETEGGEERPLAPTLL